MSNEKKNGGPAFPGPVRPDAYHGMTMRDYFAAKAMQGQFSALWSSEMEEPSMCVLGDSTAATVAESAYKMADAMIKAREQ